MNCITDKGESIGTLMSCVCRLTNTLPYASTLACMCVCMRQKIPVTT